MIGTSLGIANCYILCGNTFIRALFEFLSKRVADGRKVMLVCRDEVEMMSLDKHLWTHGRNTFLAHSTQYDPFPEQQTIYLTTNPADEWMNCHGKRELVFTHLSERAATYLLPQVPDAELLSSVAKQLRAQNCTLKVWSKDAAGKWEATCQ